MNSTGLHLVSDSLYVVNLVVYVNVSILVTPLLILFYGKCGQVISWLFACSAREISTCCRYIHVSTLRHYILYPFSPILTWDWSECIGRAKINVTLIARHNETSSALRHPGTVDLSGVARNVNWENSTHPISIIHHFPSLSCLYPSLSPSFPLFRSRTPKKSSQGI